MTGAGAPTSRACAKERRTVHPTNGPRDDGGHPQQKVLNPGRGACHDERTVRRPCPGMPPGPSGGQRCRGALSEGFADEGCVGLDTSAPGCGWRLTPDGSPLFIATRRLARELFVQRTTTLLVHVPRYTRPTVEAYGTRASLSVLAVDARLGVSCQTDDVAALPRDAGC